jgi:hypothetical protein
MEKIRVILLSLTLSLHYKQWYASSSQLAIHSIFRNFVNQLLNSLSKLNYINLKIKKIILKTKIMNTQNSMFSDLMFYCDCGLVIIYPRCICMVETVWCCAAAHLYSTMRAFTPRDQQMLQIRIPPPKLAAKPLPSYYWS